MAGPKPAALPLGDAPALCVGINNIFFFIRQELFLYFFKNIQKFLFINYLSLVLTLSFSIITIIAFCSSGVNIDKTSFSCSLIFTFISLKS